MTSPLDALIEAVENGLGDRLRALDAGVSPSHTSRSGLNDRLTGKNGPRLYSAPHTKMIAAVLDVRNQFAHGNADQLAAAPEYAVWAINTVELLLRKLPSEPVSA